MREFSTRIKDPVTNDAWHSRANNATFVEHSFRRPLTPPAMGWKLKGASHAPLRSPAAAVRRRRFRIVLIIVRRPPRGDETESRGLEAAAMTLARVGGVTVYRASGLSLFPTLIPGSPFRLRAPPPSSPPPLPPPPPPPAVPSHPIHATFSPTRVITSSSQPIPFSICTLPLADYLKVSRLDGFLAIISFYYWQWWLQRRKKARERWIQILS